MKTLNIFCDGGARGNPGPGAAAFVATGQDGSLITKKGIYLGVTTNNQAEYGGVLLAFSFLKNLKEKPQSVNFFLDSELITNQLLGRYKIKNQKLQQLVVKVKNIERELGIKTSYAHIPRSKNKQADLLVNKVLDEQTRPY